MKKLGIVLVILGLMMGTAWGSVAADVESVDIAVIRALGGQYQAVAESGEPGVDVVLSGTGDLAHLQANVTAFSRPPLPVEALDRVWHIFRRVDSVSGQ